MIVIQLPSSYPLNPIHLLRWKSTTPPPRDENLLRALRKRRKSQTKISKERQGFISGMAIDRIPGEERGQRGAYLEEWHYRMRDNEESGIFLDGVTE